MSTRKHLTAVAGLLVMAGGVVAGLPAFGEVSVNTDREGNYRYTSFLVTETPEEILFWAPVRDIAPARILNPQGDLFGDGRPAIFNDAGGGTPLVVWSQRSGGTGVLVWSSWEGDGWSPPRWVHPLPGLAEDRDPVLAADRSGRVHLIWWREEEGRGRVYASRFLGAAGWSPPRPISPVSVDARHPAVDRRSDRPAVVFHDRHGRPRGSMPLPPWGRLQAESYTNEKTHSDSDGLTDDPDVLP